jgi:threonine dehydrogenase-like Zn-dependent dehydrogenase
MRVAMYYNNNDVRLEELPTPKIGAGEMLVKVLASGICGSDVMEWYRIKKAPLVLGHEIGGEIVETGEGVTRYKTGDRVFVSHHIPCNTCYFCLNGHHTVCETLHTTNYDPGGFAEYLRVPRLNMDRLADLVIVCTGALPAFTQALQCVERAGTILFFAPTDPGVELPVPVNDFWRNGITLLPSYGASPSDCVQAIELIRAGRVPVRKMITHRLSLEETALGFKLVAQAKECIKVIIEPHKSR